MRDLIELSLFERVLSARILVCITFFYREPRLCFLAEVLRSLSEFPVAAMDVIILTNTCREEDLKVIRRLCGEILADDKYQIQSFGDLQDPRDLTWQHKEIIAAEFGQTSENRYTHFIYLEDDIRLSITNFLYFVAFRDKLRATGLLPAFVRTEYNTAMGGLVAADAFWSIYVPAQTYLHLGTAVYVNMPNPYNPCFILDSELAAEYVGTRSFDCEGSRAVCSWDVTERAAMGLCLENVPAPFQSRYVVPVLIPSNIIPAYARIAHLANNYADNPESPLGKVRIDELFAGADELSDPDSWGGGNLVRPKWTEMLCNRGCEGASCTQRGISPRVAGSSASVVELSPSRAEIENSASDEQYYLVSDHDTVLYFESQSHRLRHGPFGIAPFNLILEVVGARGWLITPEGQLSFLSSEGEMSRNSGRADPEYHIENFPDGRIGIRVDERYLCAEWDGAARNNRTWCLDFERYRLIRADTAEAMALLRCYSWVCHDDRRVVSLADQPNDFGRELPTETSALAATLVPSAIESRRELVFGPARIRIVGKDRSVLFKSRGQDGNPLTAYLEIVNPSGPNHRFSRFTPLIHYDVEGDDSNFESLHLSLSSLETYGRYCGAVCVTCDRPANELIKYIPKTFHSRLIVSAQLQGSQQLDRSGREQGLIEHYQPVLRCKPDLIFDSAIVDLLVDLLPQGKRDSAAEDLEFGGTTSK